MTREEYKSIYDVVGAAQEVHTALGRGVLLNFCEKSLRAERYLYLPDDDRFVLLTQNNYKLYITD